MQFARDEHLAQYVNHGWPSLTKPQIESCSTRTAGKFHLSLPANLLGNVLRSTKFSYIRLFTCCASRAEYQDIKYTSDRIYPRVNKKYPQESHLHFLLPKGPTACTTGKVKISFYSPLSCWDSCVFRATSFRLNISLFWQGWTAGHSAFLAVGLSVLLSLFHSPWNYVNILCQH